ncbi:MAG: 1-phosphofructokinase [Gluconacetobacter diazotrophicus]|nr:1-phosphofructokinase [Gluconacetobacter diazotrophicus]
MTAAADTTAARPDAVPAGGSPHPGVHRRGAIVTVTLNPAIDHTIRLDELETGTVHRAKSSVRTAGGKGVNVAGCLSDWRQKHEPAIVATGFLGGSNAATFEDFLVSKEIVDRFVRIPGHTRNNLKLLDEASGDTTDINLPGLSPQPVHTAQLKTVLATEAEAGSTVVLSGSLPPGMADGFYSEIIGMMNAAGARVVLDTSGRPLLTALGGPREALPWAIKPNQEELEEVAGGAFTSIDQMARTAQALCKRGVGLVVVSRGAEGALFVSDRAAFVCRPPMVLQVDTTVGAGDALVAGLVAGVLDRDEPEQVARMAMAFAAAKLTQSGPSLPNRAAVLSRIDAVGVERLDRVLES